jgi:hypothetical protein
MFVILFAEDHCRISPSDFLDFLEFQLPNPEEISRAEPWASSYYTEG